MRHLVDGPQDLAAHRRDMPRVPALGLAQGLDGAHLLHAGADRPRDRTESALGLIDHLPAGGDLPVALLHHAGDAPGVGLDGPHDGLDLLGGADGALGELADLVGDHREAPAVVTGAGRLDGGVEGEQVGLLGDVVDHLDDVADLAGLDAQFPDRTGRVLHDPADALDALGVLTDDLPAGDRDLVGFGGDLHGSLGRRSHLGGEGADAIDRLGEGLGLGAHPMGVARDLADAPAQLLDRSGGDVRRLAQVLHLMRQLGAAAGDLHDVLRHLGERLGLELGALVDAREVDGGLLALDAGADQLDVEGDHDLVEARRDARRRALGGIAPRRAPGEIPPGDRRKPLLLLGPRGRGPDHAAQRFAQSHESLLLLISPTHLGYQASLEEASENPVKLRVRSYLAAIRRWRTAS
ncbi:hypothetical protein D3C86_1221730 [compost metagenome]